MSADPAVMQQMLVQQLQQAPQGASYGGGGSGPAMQGSISPMNAASNLVQKVMLMRALQNAPQTPGGATGQQQRQANALLPSTNAQISNDPTMQALQQSQAMQPFTAQPQITLPNSQPTPGYS